jgi:hypothetical protein
MHKNCFVRYHVLKISKLKYQLFIKGKSNDGMLWTNITMKFLYLIYS